LIRRWASRGHGQIRGHVDNAASGGSGGMFIDGAGLVLGLALIQLSRTTAFGHALGSTIIAVGIAPALVMRRVMRMGG